MYNNGITQSGVSGGVTPNASDVIFAPAGGITAENVQNAIEQVFGAIPDTTRHTWTYSSSVSIDAVSTIDLTGIPSDVNEVFLDLTAGNNGSTEGNIVLQYLNQGGTVFNTSYLFGATKTSFNGNVEQMTLGSGFMLAKAYDATNIHKVLARFLRAGPGSNTWLMQFSAFGYVVGSGTNTYMCGNGARLVSGGLGGFRLTATTGQFANGSAVLGWRK